MTRSRLKAILVSYGVFYNPKKLEDCIDEIMEAIDEEDTRKSKNSKA